MKPGETVVFSWIVFKSRAHRDQVNGKVMKDPRVATMMSRRQCPSTSSAWSTEGSRSWSISDDGGHHGGADNVLRGSSFSSFCSAATARRYDRSIVEGPLRPRSGRSRGRRCSRTSSAGCRASSTTCWSATSSASRQRGDRRELADLPRRHRLHHVAVHRHERARRALRRRGRRGQGRPHRLPGVPHGDRHLAAGIMAPLGYFAVAVRCSIS